MGRLRVKRTGLPTAAVRPAVHWCKRGLQVLITGEGGLKNLVAGRPQPSVLTGTIAVSKVGGRAALQFGGGFLDTNWIPASGNFTAVLAYTTYGFGGATGTMVAMNRKASEASRAEIWLDNSFAAIRYVTACEFIGGATAQAYPNLPPSLQMVEQTLVTGGAAGNATSSFFLGGAFNFGDINAGVDSTWSWSGEAYGIALFDGNLSQTEKQQLSQNFWQLAEAVPRNIYQTAPSGVNRIISAGPGNAAADGVTASIVRSIGASPGNAVADGTTAGVNRIISTTVGNAVADGITATISTSGTTTISCTPGNAVADGITAAVTRTITSSLGNAVADGTTAAVTRTIGAATGNAVADGVQAALIQKIAASPGDAVANGSIAALIRTIAASPGNAVADGVTASILSNVIISASPGNAVANGVAATITNASPTIGRPDTDTSNTGWTPSTGVDLYAMIDEVVTDDADYIYTNSAASVCEMALNTTAYPGTASQVFEFRASSDYGNTVQARLKNTGGATVATWTQALTSTPTTYQKTLTSGEIAAITSGALSLELTAA